MYSHGSYIILYCPLCTTMQGLLHVLEECVILEKYSCALQRLTFDSELRLHIIF